MEIKLIELYCLICCLYDSNPVLKQQRLSNFKPVFTDQELVTGYFLAMLNHQLNKQEIYDYLQNHWRAWFPTLPSYQAFSHRLNLLATDFALIFNSLVQAKFKLWQPDFSDDSLIDSFPVMLKKGTPAKRCQTASEIAGFGYCVSKNIYYHGVKLHNLAIRRFSKLPLPFQVFLTPAATHDLTAFKHQRPRIPTRNLFADSAEEEKKRARAV